MSQLAGKFAGIVKVGMDMPHAEMLKASLDMLAGLKVTAEISVPPATSQMHRMMLSLVGHDRIGIVREITQALARHAVNVEKLTTFISSAPMSAESLFHAQALLQLPVALDPRTLACELEKISDDLMVELSISEE